MDLGFFSSGLLTGLREGVEASLIVSIILAYLARTGNTRHFGKIAIGTSAAVAFSLVAGAAIFWTVGEFREPYEQMFEGATMLLAAGVVTWMLFWMRRQSASVKGELQAAVDRVLTAGNAWSLAALAFVAVIREGLETSLFLVGQTQAASQGSHEGAASVLFGALVGLAIALGLGYGFYRGTRRINLARFFRWTGVALVFIAAGLLSGAIHEFSEIGAITIGAGSAFDLGGVLSDEVGVGAFLHAIFGYASAPEVSRLVVHLSYLVVVLALYLRPIRVVAAPPAVAPEVARS